MAVGSLLCRWRGCGAAKKAACAMELGRNEPEGLQGSAGGRLFKQWIAAIGDAVVNPTKTRAMRPGRKQGAHFCRSAG